MVELQESQGFKDQGHVSLEGAQQDVPSVFPHGLDQAHDGPEPSGADVTQIDAIDQDGEPAPRHQLLQRALELPDRMGIDETAGMQHSNAIPFADLDREIWHS